MSDADHDSRLELARTISRQAGQITLKYFQTDGFQVIRKQDGSPLTIADQESETFLRAEIKKNFPNDEIVGEEFGTTPGDSGFCWVLDPIDGTKSFISGVPLYGTMVGVLQETQTGPADPVRGRETRAQREPGQREPGQREAIIGAVYLPGLDEGIYAAQGQGAWHYRGNQIPVRAAVSKTARLADAVLATSEVETFGDRKAAAVYQSLAEQVYFARTWGDVYGYLLVATGRIDVMIDPILNVWDAAAVQPIIQEAGGRFTDWHGQPRIDSGDSIGSNGLLHEEVLMSIKKHEPNHA